MNATAPRRRFGADIEGLRAIAILGVVLFHAHVAVLSGGYVGVDVFFVISGYLITDLLWRELEDRGRISFSSFYGRRMRRLLPASMLVIVVTAAGSARWLPPLQVPGVLRDGLASALYVGNYRFAVLQTNYLTSTAPPSPYQHFWSLGVEEQFYLVWPLVLVLASVAWRRRSAARPNGAPATPSRNAAAVALAIIAAGSFALSLWLTSVSEPWAFYSLPTRAWELAVGGLIALSAPLHQRVPVAAAAVLGWVGLAMIAWSMFALSATTPFPGVAALGPVLGAGAVILAGRVGPLHGPVVLLKRGAMQLMGRISYSWYLWHWPVLILVPYAVGHALALWQNLALAAASGVLALVTYATVENPVRSSRWLSAVPRRSLATGTALTVAAASVCVLAGVTLPSLQGQGIAPVATLGVGQRHAPGRARVTGRKPTEADLLQARVAGLTAQVQAALRRSVAAKNVPSNLEPPLQDARVDGESAPFVDGCLDSYLDTAVAPCAFGDLSAHRTVVLFGDSHATMWYPAIDRFADDEHFKLLVLTKATCPPLLLAVFSPILGREFTECTQWRDNVLARIRADHPALVVLGVARHYNDLYHFTVYSPQWLPGMAGMVRTIRALGPRVAVMGPVPKPRSSVPDCLSVHLNDASACTERIPVGINEVGLAAERAAVERAGGFYIDPQRWFCTATRCAQMVDNLLVYFDDNHLTQNYAAFLGPVVQAQLQVALLSGSTSP